MTGRIAITGTGAICAAGHDVPSLWDAARTGRSCIGTIDFEHARGNRVRLGAPVPDFDPQLFADAMSAQMADKYSLYALHAALQATRQAGLEAGALGGSRTGLIVGTGIGGIATLDNGFRAYYTDQKGENYIVPKAMPSSAVANLCIALGITGPSYTVTSACASASQAIGMAMLLIRSGAIDRAVTGGSEACLTPATMRSWEYLRVLTNDACRPFSVGRSGMVIGEGAGIFVIESEAAMLARGAKPLAWLAGYGTTSDARDMLLPDAGGAAAAIEAAIEDAGLSNQDIGYINAHGTGTVANDINEAEALRLVFGEALDAIPVSSSKPIFGHTLGAAGALELLVTLAALRAQSVPPQINCKAQDPKCALNLPLDGARDHSFSAALSNSFGFGGVNAALILRAA